MSSIEVDYPTEVKQYQISITRDLAKIVLEGIEGVKLPQQRLDSSELRIVGRIVFGDPDPIGNKDFVTRDGVLRMDRPLSMLSGILNLLQHEKPLFLHEDGTLSTSLEPVGETESPVAAG
jgi:hypothetical protein